MRNWWALGQENVQSDVPHLKSRLFECVYWCLIRYDLMVNEEEQPG